MTFEKMATGGTPPRLSPLALQICRANPSPATRFFVHQRRTQNGRFGENIQILFTVSSLIDQALRQRQPD